MYVYCLFRHLFQSPISLTTPTLDMAQGLLHLRGVQPQAHYEDIQGIQQTALLQNVSQPLYNVYTQCINYKCACV